MTEYKKASMCNIVYIPLKDTNSAVFLCNNVSNNSFTSIHPKIIDRTNNIMFSLYL